MPEDENDPDGSYTWIISNLAPGEYEIFATWPKLFARSSGFDHLGGSVDVVTSISGGADPVHIEEEVNFGADPIYATGGIFENGVAWERIAANVTVESDNNMVTVHVNTKNSDNQAASGSKLYLLADAIRIKRISSDIALTKYEYDHRNLLTRVENFSDTAGTTLANATDYYYDVLGRRVGKEHTAGSAHSAERFVLDGNQIAMIEEVDSDNNLSQTRHLWATAVDQLLALDETSTPSGGNPDHKKTTWTLPDHQGTVKDYMGRKDATEESKLLYTVQTSPFGTPVGGKAWVDQATLNEFAKVDSGSRFIYTGQYFDIETGLQYSRARYYDPATREFVSQDPIQLAGGDPNFYRYGFNSHPNGTDPSGNVFLGGAGVFFLSTGLFSLVVGALAVDNAAESFENHSNAFYSIPRSQLTETDVQSFNQATQTFRHDVSLGTTLAATGAGLALAPLLPALSAGTSLFGKIAVGTGFGIAEGAAFGGLQAGTEAYALGLDRQQILRATGRGAVVGGTIGGLTGGALPAVGALGRNVLGRFRGPRIAPLGPDDFASVRSANRTSIETPYGAAIQDGSATALRARAEIQGGARVYKGGALGRSETGASQFLATESPLNPGYAARYGIPSENAAFDFILTGRVRQGAPVITRPAPGIPPNPGGGIEGVIRPGDFIIDSFHMP